MSDAEVVGVISPGRTAERIGGRQAQLTCEGCGWSTVIERADGEPLSLRDLSEALLGFICEGCGA